MIARSKPYFWVTRLTPLLAGEDSCEWKVWFKSHYQNYDKIHRDGASLSEWEEKHTALLNKLKAEYKATSGQVLVEGQTAWKIEGKSAIVAGKMDLIALNPNLVIDAKGGKPKSSHVVQVKLYLLAIELGAVPGVQGHFSGVLGYPDGHKVDVLQPDKDFKERFYSLVKRLATVEAETVPSKYECEFCDLADCTARFDKESVLQTAEF